MCSQKTQATIFLAWPHYPRARVRPAGPLARVDQGSWGGHSPIGGVPAAQARHVPLQRESL